MPCYEMILRFEAQVTRRPHQMTMSLLSTLTKHPVRLHVDQSLVLVVVNSSLLRTFPSMLLMRAGRSGALCQKHQHNSCMLCSVQGKPSVCGMGARDGLWWALFSQEGNVLTTL